MSETPVLVTVTLSPPLFDLADAVPTIVVQRAEAELAGLMRELHVSGQPEVRLEGIDSHLATHLMRLSVGGRPCRFPGTTVAERLAYIDGTPEIPQDDESVLDRLREVPGDGGERVAELIASVCRAAVSAQPGILLGRVEEEFLHSVLELGLPLIGLDDGTTDATSEDGDPLERLIAANAAKTIDVEIDPAYLHILSGEAGGDELFPFARDGLFVELGLPLPAFHFSSEPSLRPGGFNFRFGALRTSPHIGLSAGTVLVNETAESLALLDFDAVPTLNPATHQLGAVVAQEQKESLEAAGFTTWEPFGFLILSFAAAVRQCAHALMTRDVAKSMVQELGRAFPALEDAARTVLPPDVLAPVLRELLHDQVPIRNLRRIVELLLRYETGDENHRTDRLAFVRWGLANIIASKAARGTNTVITYLLAPELEDAVANHLDRTMRSESDDAVPDRLLGGLRAEVSEEPRDVQLPVLLTQDELRGAVRDMIRHEFPQMTVLSYGDLPPDYIVQPVARIS